MVDTEVRDTRERLLDAAEKLLGERGLAASLRDITNAADANVAAVNYHFGSKTALLEAVLMRRWRPLNEERNRLLAEAVEAETEAGPSLEAILASFIGPTVRTCWRHPDFMRFVGRTHLDAEDIHRAMLRDESFLTLVARFRVALLGCLPDAPVDELWWRMHFVVGAMINTWTDWNAMEELSQGEARFDGEDALIRRLVAFSCAGLRDAVVKEEP